MVTTITNWNELNDIRNDLSGDYELGDNIGQDSAGYETHVTDPQRNWEPIGDDANKFTGSFDGNGYRIAGFKTQRNVRTVPGDPENYRASGIFGVVGASGSVSNVSVNGEIGADMFCGAIAGVNFGTISSCSVSVTTSRGPDKHAEATYQGAICGSNEGIVSGCYARYEELDFGGGLVGINWASMADCRADITGLDFDSVTAPIAKMNAGTIDACIASDYTFGEQSEGIEAGFVVQNGVEDGDTYKSGDFAGTITECYDVLSAEYQGINSIQSSVAGSTEDIDSVSIDAMTGASASTTVTFDFTNWETVQTGDYRADRDHYPVRNNVDVVDQIYQAPIGARYIYDWNDLQDVDNHLASDHVLANDIDSNTDGYSSQVSSNNAGWVPIGDGQPIAYTSNDGFKATFAGQNREIADLVVTEVPFSAGNGYGLFLSAGSSTNDVHIRNINLADCDIDGGYGAGIVASLGENAVVSGCSVSGTVSNGGGIAAVAYNNAEIHGCTVDATISSSGPDTGGIVGRIFGGSHVHGCSFTGDVSGSDHTGGIVGMAKEDSYGEPYVTVSYTEGSVSGSNEVGGIVGRSYGDIEKVYTADTATISGDNHVGGIAGTSTKNIYNSYTFADISGDKYVGGIVGTNFGNVFRVYAVANPTASTGTAVGAIAGQNGGLESSFNYIISQDYTNASISDAYFNSDVAFVPGTSKNVGSSVSYIDGLTEWEMVGGKEISGFYDSAWEFLVPGTLSSSQKRGGYPVLEDMDIQRQAVIPQNLAIPVRDWNDLNDIRNDISEDYRLYPENGQYLDSDTTGYDQHVANPANGWKTIFQYNGNFNGDGYGIYELVSTGDPSPTPEAGLFSFTQGTVENVSVAGKIETPNIENVGMLVGKALGPVKNCHAVTTNFDTNRGVVVGKTSVGGLVGRSESTIENCSSDVDVESKADTSGGIVGTQIDKDVTSCTVTANEIRSKNNLAGGIAGAVEGESEITQCTSECSVVAENKKAGGVVGEHVNNTGGDIQNCSFSGSVSAVEQAGGIAGFCKARINLCKTSGSVSVSNTLVGGISGYLFHVPANGNNPAIISESYSNATVSGGNFAGGVCGYNGGSVQNSYATGDVSGSDTVGGLVGCNTGSLTRSYTISLVTGSQNVATLAGRNGIEDADKPSSIIESGEESGYIDNAHTLDNNTGVPTVATQTATSDEITTSVLTDSQMSGSTPTSTMDSFQWASNQFSNDIWLSVEKEQFGELNPKRDAFPVINNLDIQEQLVLADTGSIEVSDWNELASMQNFLSESYTLINDLDENSTGYDNQVSNPSDGWSPIGSFSSPFKGSFDGNNNTIKDFVIDSTDSDVGLFSATDLGATIENINVVGASVSGDVDVGCIVGEHNGATIESVSVSGNVEGTTVGGIAGESTGSIIDSESSVSITQSNTGNVGGIVGRISSSGSVEDSKFTGNIDVSQNRAGGIVGSVSTGTVSNATVNAPISGGRSTGGVVGSGGDVTVTNSVSEGTVSGDKWVGGIAGAVQNSDISNSYSTCSVSGTDYIGGLIGVVGYTSSFDYCFASGSVTATNNYAAGLISYIGESTTVQRSHCSGTVDSANDAGGFVAQNAGTVELCYTVSNITSSDTGAFAYQNGVDSGTFAGTFPTQDTAGSITDCYYDTDVSAASPVQVTKHSSQATIDGNETEDMVGLRAEQSMPALDYTTVWETVEAGEYQNAHHGYPILRDIDTTVQITAPYTGLTTITDWQGLHAMRFDLDADYELGSNLTSSTDGYDEYIRNNQNGWEQIGSPTTPFTGSLSGNTYNIEDLDVSGSQNIGLFARADATIENITFNNVNISGDAEVGAIAGRFSGTCNNIDVNGTISGSSNVGSIAGVLTGTVSSSSADTTVSGDDYVACIAGRVQGGTISNTTASGTVDGTNYVGGIAGELNSTIEGSSVTGTISGNEFVGGLAGSSNGSIQTSYAIVDITATRIAGGIAGRSRSDANKCFSAGSVEADTAVGGGFGLVVSGGTVIENSYTVMSVSGTNVVGGFIGANGGSVQECYSAVGIGSGSGVGAFVGINGIEADEIRANVPQNDDNGLIDDCYYDTALTLSGSVSSEKNGSSSVIHERTTSEMTGDDASSEMDELDFSNVWSIIDISDPAFDKNGYPALNDIAFTVQYDAQTNSLGLQDAFITVQDQRLDEDFTISLQTIDTLGENTYLVVARKTDDSEYTVTHASTGVWTGESEEVVIGDIDAVPGEHYVSTIRRPVYPEQPSVGDTIEQDKIQQAFGSTTVNIGPIGLDNELIDSLPEYIPKSEILVEKDIEHSSLIEQGGDLIYLPEKRPITAVADGYGVIDSMGTELSVGSDIKAEDTTGDGRPDTIRITADIDDDSTVKIKYLTEPVITRYFGQYEYQSDVLSTQTLWSRRGKYVDTAYGQQLDLIGDMFGIIGERRGRSDEEYRQFLRSIISVFNGTGTRSDIRTAIGAAIRGPSGKVTIQEDYINVAFRVIVGNYENAVYTGAIEELVDIARPSGVDLIGDIIFRGPKATVLVDANESEVVAESAGLGTFLLGNEALGPDSSSLSDSFGTGQYGADEYGQ